MSFGSPAADYIEPKLDLNRLLAPHPVSTYFLRMDTDRLRAECIMPREGVFAVVLQGGKIKKGDILVIDRSCPPRPGKFVVAETGGEFRVVRYVSRPATGIACGVWGVVTSVIRQLS